VSVFGICTRLWSGQPRRHLIPGRNGDTFLFARVSKLGVVLTVQWLQGVLCQLIHIGSGAYPALCGYRGFFPHGESGLVMKLTADVCLILRLRMDGTLTLFHQVSSCCGANIALHYLTLRYPTLPYLLVTCLVNRNIFLHDHLNLYVVHNFRSGMLAEPVSCEFET
jgi:hypothetical protein